MASEPPSLEEPLVRLNSNLQGWLDQVLRSFAAQLSAESQAQHERLEALAQELRGETSELRRRFDEGPRAAEASEDHRVPQLQQEMKKLQQQLLENQLAARRGGSGADASLALMVSNHDEELKNLARSVSALQASVGEVQELKVLREPGGVLEPLLDAEAEQPSELTALQADPVSESEATALQRADEAHQKLAELSAEVAELAHALEAWKAPSGDLREVGEEETHEHSEVLPEASDSQEPSMYVASVRPWDQTPGPCSEPVADRLTSLEERVARLEVKDQTATNGEAFDPATLASPTDVAPDTATAATEQAAEAEATAEEAIDVVTEEPTAAASKVDQAAVDPAADVASTAGDLAPASPVDPPAEKPPEAASDPAAHEAEEAAALAEGVQARLSSLEEQVADLAAHMGKEAKVEKAASDGPCSLAIELKSQVKALAEALEASKKASGPEEAALERLSEKVSSLEEKLSPKGSLVQEVKALALALESQAEQAVSSALEEQVEAMTTELQAVQKRLADLEPKVPSLSEQLQRQTQQLSAKVDASRLAEKDLKQQLQQLMQTMDSRDQSSQVKLKEALEAAKRRQEEFQQQSEALQRKQLNSMREDLRVVQASQEASAKRSAELKQMTTSLEKEQLQLASRLRQEGGRLKQLQQDMQVVKEAILHIQQELKKEVVIPEHVLKDLDAKNEARLEAVWKELHQHAEAAATRADRLEQGLSLRLQSLEQQTLRLVKAEEHTRCLEQDMQKQSEWLAWRIAWLEWATTGEKRSFARALPPPFTPAATCFKQPLTEDSELWAQEKGRQRLRRAPLSMPNAAAANERFAMGGSSSTPELQTIGKGATRVLPEIQ